MIPQAVGGIRQAWYHRALADTVNACMDYCGSDSEILANIANSGAGAENVLLTAKRVLGYDGYIVDNKYENSTVYVTFTSEQFKNTSNKTPTANPDFRFALPDNSDAYSEEDANTLANYSEKEYNSFGWARAAEALSHAELDDLYAKIQARSSLYTFRRSKNGEFIIEVNNKPHTTLDVDNVFVFVKGTTKAFTIARVVRFDVQTETEMDSIRRTLYEGRTCNDTYIRLNEEKGLAREYRRENSQSFAEYSKERAERRSGNGETSRGDDRNHRRSEKYRSGYYLHIGEDGEITETFGNKINSPSLYYFIFRIADFA